MDQRNYWAEGAREFLDTLRTLATDPQFVVSMVALGVAILVFVELVERNR